MNQYLLKVLRECVFGLLHSVSHPGAKSTVRLVCNRYVWPYMHRDIVRHAGAKIVLIIKSLILPDTKSLRHRSLPLRISGSNMLTII